MNTILVVTYWLVGWRIVAFEQAGKKRAEYGSKLLEKLSTDLIKKFGKGFGYVNLNLMRQFFLAYSPKEILQRVSEESDSKTALPAFPPVSTLFHVLSVRFRLPWSHYCLLIRLEERLKGEFYLSRLIRTRQRLLKRGLIHDLLTGKISVQERIDAYHSKLYDRIQGLAPIG